MEGFSTSVGGGAGGVCCNNTELTLYGARRNITSSEDP